MRLIDADVLVEELKSNINHMQRIIDMKLCDGIKDYRDTERMMKYGYVLNVINEQPTAYDVDKVISEIEKCSIDNTDWGYSTNPKLASYYLSRTAEVIDIVKRGGVDDI